VDIVDSGSSTVVFLINCISEILCYGYLIVIDCVDWRSHQLWCNW